MVKKSVKRNKLPVDRRIRIITKDYINTLSVSELLDLSEKISSVISEKTLRPAGEFERKITDIVCENDPVYVIEVLNAKRVPKRTKAYYKRNMLAYFLFRYGMSKANIAGYMLRAHSSIIHSINIVSDALAINDPEYDDFKKYDEQIKEYVASRKNQRVSSDGETDRRAII